MHEAQLQFVLPLHGVLCRAFIYSCTVVKKALQKHPHDEHDEASVGRISGKSLAKPSACQ